MVEHAVTQILRFREISDLRKAPATGELIDWVRILLHWEVAAGKLGGDKRLVDLPYWQALFKHERDLGRVRELHGEKSKQ
jgi:hypothetical protein